MAFYYSEGFKRPVAEKLFERPNTWDNSDLCVSIYSGSQPTDANFLSDWGTNYYFNNSNSAVGSSLLGVYGDLTNSQAPGDVLSITSNGGANNGDAYSWHLSDTGFKKTWFANGTASWGVIWRASDFQSLTQATAPHAIRYIIAPVTNSAGNGALKLYSTTVTNPIPDLEDISINITMT